MKEKTESKFNWDMFDLEDLLIRVRAMQMWFIGRLSAQRKESGMANLDNDYLGITIEVADILNQLVKERSDGELVLPKEEK